MSTYREAKAHDKMTGEKRKQHRECKKRAATKEIKPGDKILTQQQKTTVNYTTLALYTVAKVKGTQVTASRGDLQKLRSMAKCKV